MLDEVGVLRVKGEDLSHKARRDDGNDLLSMNGVLVEKLEDTVGIELQACDVSGSRRRPHEHFE